MTKQKLSQRKKLRSAAAKKGWETRRENLAKWASLYPQIAPRKIYWHTSICGCDDCERERGLNFAPSLNTANLREPTPEELALQRAGWAKSCVTVDVTQSADPNPWPRFKAWVRRVLGIR